MCQQCHEQNPKKTPTPLFPLDWIKIFINHDRTKHSFKFKKSFSYIYKTPKSDEFTPELPLDGSQEAIDLFKTLAHKEADPNYIKAILWFFSNPKMYYEDIFLMLHSRNQFIKKSNNLFS